MNCLLDTHFIIWIVTESKRLRNFKWLQRYAPWGVSPTSLLEIQFLSEIGRLDVRNPDFNNAILSDSRFIVDEAPLLNVVRKSLDLSWTRDPFDRMIAAHSLMRRAVLCTADENMLRNHKLLAPELR